MIGARGVRPLPWRLLRELTVDARRHPRGQAHLSAASGLVCAVGRAYVIADDEHHLAVFTGLDEPGTLHRITEGDLPRQKAARKRRKPDLESLMWLPAGLLGPGRGAALLALGSGSTEQRDRGWLVPVGDDGELQVEAARSVDLAPLYDPLRERLGEINIEGALLLDDELVLLHRGGSGRRGANAIARYAAAQWRPLWLGEADGGPIAARALKLCPLGDIAGVGLGFTDGTALPAGVAGGGFLFTAVAEASADSVADGACVGSVIGHIDAELRLRWMRPLAGSPKVEGLALHVAGGATDLCLVTDADDPAQASDLLHARLSGFGAGEPGSGAHPAARHPRGSTDPSKPVSSTA